MKDFRRKANLLPIAALVLSWVAVCRPASAADHDDFFHRLSFELTGGLRWASVGDIGGHIGAIDSFLYDFCTEINYLPGQLRKPGPWGPDVALALRLDLRPGLSVAIGTGFLEVYDSSSSYGIGSFSSGTPDLDPRSITTYVRSDIRSIPVQAEVSRSWRLSRNISFTAGMGASVTFSSIRLHREMGIHPIFYNVTESIVWPHLDDHFRLKGIGFGPLGKAGLELRISSPLTLLFEVEGRYARTARLKGRQKYSYYSPIDNEYFVSGEAEGTLQIGTSDKTVMGLTGDFPDLSVSPSQSMRPARLDLSGFSCRLGVRFRFH